MCGIFGVFNNKEAAELTYLGLYALQHRGQESCGIVSTDKKKFYQSIGMGLISDVFQKDVLSGLKGNSAIGHSRYSTAGSTVLDNAQPISIKFIGNDLAIAHNGNLCNYRSLRLKLEKEGSIFQTTSDSEVILHLIARSRRNTLEERIKDALEKVKGAYSILFLTQDKMIAVRDPLGIRPLCLGKVKNSFIVSSETCAFDLLGARYIRDIEPGEMAVFSGKGLVSRKIFRSPRKACCIFEYVYFSRPDSKVFGRPVYTIRREFGRQLARELAGRMNLKNADIVIPVPDSANVAAVGFSEQSGIPYEIGFIRNHYIGRTFIEPEQRIRDFGVKIKYNPVNEALKGKEIILVDDSIVRGTTSRKLIRMLRKAGVKKIHHVISSPPIRYSCFYGIDTPVRDKLIASHKNIEQIRKFIEVDSLYYLSLDGMVRSTGMKKNDFCLACFNGDYVIRPEK
ncbi:MAG: amidophosphoribosyltransferase [bacterium]|nr:amidophosphoribosyltransferase [bacterium]